MKNLVVIDDQWVLIVYHTVIPKKRQAVWCFRKCKTINWKTTRHWLSNGEGTRETSVTTNIPENERIQFTLGDNHQLLYEADHDVKNCTDRGYCYPSAKLDKSLQALHTSSHFRMIVLSYYLGHRLSLAFFSARFQDTHDIQPTLDNSKQSRFPLDFLRTLAWISAITSRVVFTPSAKQPSQFFVFTFFHSSWNSVSIPVYFVA